MPARFPDGEHERMYVIPLRDAYRAPRRKRAKVAIKLIRDFVRHHLRYNGEVKIGNELNEYIWQRSIEKPPRRVAVVVKFKVEEGEIVSTEVNLATPRREVEGAAG
uniref:Large ribosomal subunit protein eL31 n=1 Tax=Thermofilum pendens TaxID=2269 RepID=A0A7C1T6N5_THEPE